MRQTDIERDKGYMGGFLKHLIKTDRKYPSFDYLIHKHRRFYQTAARYYMNEGEMFEDLGLESLLESDYLRKK